MLFTVPAYTAEGTVCRFKCSLVACPSMEWWEDSIGVMLPVVIIHVCHWLKLICFLVAAPYFIMFMAGNMGNTVFLLKLLGCGQISEAFSEWSI
jgi:hypothetical protein